MTTQLNEYINFKTKQLMRLTGFDAKQSNAKEKLKALVSPKLKCWVAEAMQAGC